MTIESIGNTFNLLKNVPKEVLGKLNISSLFSANENEDIEVVVLYGEQLNEVRALVDSLGGTLQDLGYGFGIITIKINEVISLAKSPYVQYIEFPKSLYLSDSSSNKAACIDRARSEFNLQGEGVVIGFIDTGIDYTHPAFLNEDGTTRVEYIYDLSLNGAIYNKAQINEALKNRDPYSIVQSYDNVEHGTHVVGIACAGGNINPRYYGVAPRSSIMMVKSGRGLFTLSTNLMKGIKFLIDKSIELKMPLAINISMSTNDGAHNGTSLLEQYISTVSSLDRVTIVIAAGNEGDAAHHVSRDLNKVNIIKFEVAEDETAVVINLYKSILPNISLILTTPSGVSTSEISVSEGFYEGVISGNRYQIYDTGPRPFDISGEIGISLISDGNYILSGTWTIELRVNNEYEGIFDMWLPISEGLNKRTKFLQPTLDGTLGIPATVPNVISVGSYNYLTKSISSFSGRGRQYELYLEAKPDLVAPGEGISAPIPNRSFDIKSGTSMAAPHVSGISALMMEWGILRGNDPYLYGERLKYFLIIGSKKERRDIVYPDTSWGYGEVCLYNSMNELYKTLNIVSTRKNIFRQDNIFNLFFEYNIESTEVVGFIAEYADRDKFLQLNNIEGVSAVTLSELYGIVYLPINKIPIIFNYIKSLVNDITPEIFTLNDISPLEASDATFYHNNPYLNLNGRGVILGVVDTGIDYLNTEFQKEDDTTRILRIWDQTINSEKEVYGLKLGTEYTEEQINEAIKLEKSGGDPYSVVPSRDLNGHGTMVSGLAAARGKNNDLIGIAPNCDIAVVKLREANGLVISEAGVTNQENNRYDTIDILSAFRYLSLLAIELKRPIVILISFGSNIGAHGGLGTLDGFITGLSRQVGVVFVSGTGNEGDTDTHTEGKIDSTGATNVIELKVDKNQKNINFQVWISKPDVVSVSVTSPSGEVIEKISTKLGGKEDIKFTYEGTIMAINYSIPEPVNGDELITIRAKGLREGIWRFTLHGDYIVDGRYWAWLPQRSLLEKDTRFINPSPYTTLTIPSGARTSVSVAYYNQNNNSVVGSSGRGFLRDGTIKPDIAAGGINAKVIKPGGGIGVATGSSVATSIAAGICILIFQWGIVDGNKVDITAEQLISYIIRGAKMRAGDVYPNREWGYGMINVSEIFDAIRGEYYESRGNINVNINEYNIGSLFIRAPKKNSQ